MYGKVKGKCGFCVVPRRKHTLRRSGMARIAFPAIAAPHLPTLNSTQLNSTLL